eukprot:scaffold1147_cov125-Isochrysis_galbana.AAC.1
MAALKIIVSASRSDSCVSSRPRHRARSSRRRVQRKINIFRAVSCNSKTGAAIEYVLGTLHVSTRA